MVFAWDEHKNVLNQRKHGISFEVAARVFADPAAVSYVDQIIEGQKRWHTIGLVGPVVILLVVHTVKESNEEEIRIISARKATPRERDTYDSSQ